MYAEDGSRCGRSEVPSTAIFRAAYKNRGQLQENPLASLRQGLPHDRNMKNKWEKRRWNMMGFFLQNPGESGLHLG